MTNEGRESVAHVGTDGRGLALIPLLVLRLLSPSVRKGDDMDCAWRRIRAARARAEVREGRACGEHSVDERRSIEVCPTGAGRVRTPSAPDSVRKEIRMRVHQPQLETGKGHRRLAPTLAALVGALAVAVGLTVGTSSAAVRSTPFCTTGNLTVTVFNFSEVPSRRARGLREVLPDREGLVRDSDDQPDLPDRIADTKARGRPDRHHRDLRLAGADTRSRRRRPAAEQVPQRHELLPRELLAQGDVESYIRRPVPSPRPLWGSSSSSRSRPMRPSSTSTTRISRLPTSPLTRARPPR